MYRPPAFAHLNSNKHKHITTLVQRIVVINCRRRGALSHLCQHKPEPRFFRNREELSMAAIYSFAI